MNNTLKENQMYHTFTYLVANVLCIIMEKDDLGKFDAKANEALFIGYSSTSNLSSV